MPISRKDFDAGKFKIKYTDRLKHPVAILLRENKGLAFTIKEITKKTRMNEDAVRSMVRNLELEEKVIIHKAPYFAWKKK